MFDETDESLFSHILANSKHVLQYLFEGAHSQYNLRTNVHNKELMTKTSQLNERLFCMDAV